MEKQNVTLSIPGASSDLGRIRPLAELNAVRQSDLDGVVAQYEAAEANLRAARIQLG